MSIIAERVTTAAPPATPLTVAIIIPAFNEAKTIERCLRAAADQTTPAAEIIVVDNRSIDDTAALARRFAESHPEAAVRVISQTAEQGLVPTRNAGFAAASADILGRIDADTAIAHDWVAQVGTAMAGSVVGAVSGPVTYYDLPFRYARHLSDDLARRTLRGIAPEYPFLFGSNMAIRASAWREIEHAACLDHDDLMHEDIDLSVHLRDAGIAVAYVSRLQAAISARRLQTSPDSFRSYTQRFERTYRSHRIEERSLLAPQVLLRSVYWWARILRSLTPPAPVEIPSSQLPHRRWMQRHRPHSPSAAGARTMKEIRA